MDHDRYLHMALEEAELARDEEAMPVGAVIVAPNGTVLSRGRNRVLSRGDQTAHAEMDAIRNAGTAIATATPGMIAFVEPHEGYYLYTSAEPCLMCLGAILFCNVGTIVWATASVTGNAHAAIMGSEYQTERVRGLRVIIEPSSGHRARSRALLREFYLRLGHPRLASLLA